MQPKLLSTLRTYNLSLFKTDAISGVTVALVAIPLSLAIAIASGAKPETGLFTAIIAGFLISFLGGSRVQIGGPTGAFIVVVFGVIAEHGYDGLVLATFMAGIILVLSGLLRFGRLIRYIPMAVIDGFTLGIAVIIATSQLKDFFGLDVMFQSAGFIDKLQALWSARASFHLDAVLVGGCTMALIVFLRQKFPKFPGLVFALAVVSLAVAATGMSVTTLQSQFGPLPSSLPIPTLPEFSYEKIIEMVPSSFVIAFLAGVESLLSAMVADRLIVDTHKPNAEMLAQGIANLGSALFAGLPATGAIARTATNIQAGGKTPVAGMIHALVILGALLFAAPLAGYLVMPSLAGLLILVSWNMSEPKRWKSHLLDGKLTERSLLWLTFLLTVLVDLTVAIGVGVVVGLAIRLHKNQDRPSTWSVRKK